MRSGHASSKPIRKWHLNKMTKEGITESIADFILRVEHLLLLGVPITLTRQERQKTSTGEL